MSSKKLLQQTFSLILVMFLLIGCGGTQNVPPTATPTPVPPTVSSYDDLIIGKWEAEDGLIMEFREFNDEDDPEWRTLSGNEQSGIVILTYPNEPVAQMGTYLLAKGGKILNFSLRANTDPSQPGSGIMSIGVTTHLYALDEVTEDKLIMHQRPGYVLKRVTE